MRALIALIVVGCLAACATPFRYAEIGPQNPYGYRDTPNADGSYTILIVMPAYGSTANAGIGAAQAPWDQRAAELCGHTNYRRIMFRAHRPTVHYDNYGGRPGDFYLEGYAFCDAAQPVAEPVAPVAPNG